MLQFVREIPLRILIEKASSGRRGFLFFVSAGFSKDIDPLSGMSVNLVDVDAWLEQLKVLLEATSFTSFESAIVSARSFLQEQAEHSGAQLQSVVFREERGFSISSEADSEVLVWSYPQYIEFFEAGQGFELYRLHFSWEQAPLASDDFQHEGFKLVKGLQVSSYKSLLKSLAAFKGLRLQSGSELKTIIVDSIRTQIQHII